MGKITTFIRKSLWQDPNYDMSQKPGTEVTIYNVDPALYEKLLSEATAAGAKFNGDKVTFKGCDFNWSYDGAASIRYTCTAKPFYFSDALIESELLKLVDRARTAI